MTTPAGYATLGLYAASLILYVRFLYVNQRLVGRAATLCLAGGVLLHWQALLERARAVNSVPYQDLYGSMSLFAWLLAVTYLLLEGLHRQRSVGPFVLPFVMLLMVLATVLAPTTPPAPPPAQGSRFALHVTLNILAYSAFALSFVLSSIYLLQHRVLRDRRLGATFWRFPALEVLERMSRSSVVVGIAGLSLGTLLGYLEASRLWGGEWRADPKIVASLVVLGCYCGYLWLARTRAWRGARASLVCIVNFLVVLFSYTVVNLYLSQYHRYF